MTVPSTSTRRCASAGSMTGAAQVGAATDAAVAESIVAATAAVAELLSGSEFQLSADGWPVQLMLFRETSPLAKSERGRSVTLTNLLIAGPSAGVAGVMEALETMMGVPVKS